MEGWAVFLIPWMVIHMVFADVDPCVQVQNDYIPNLTGRRVDCTYSNYDMMGCDISLLNKWYKSKNKIATSAPKMGSCGTTHPIWINDTIPKVSDGKVTRTACVRTFTGLCDKSYEIEVKNCTFYYAYHLVPTTACKERYCFESSSTIPCTTTTTTTTKATTTVARTKGTLTENRFSEGEEVCIKLSVFIAMVIVLVAIFAIVLTAAVCIKRKMCLLIESRPVTPTSSFPENPKKAFA